MASPTMYMLYERIFFSIRNVATTLYLCSTVLRSVMVGTLIAVSLLWPSGPSMIFCYDRCAAAAAVAAAASSRSSCIAPLRLVLGQKSRQTVGNNDDASRQIRSGYLCSAAG